MLEEPVLILSKHKKVISKFLQRHKFLLLHFGDIADDMISFELDLICLHGFYSMQITEIILHPRDCFLSCAVLSLDILFKPIHADHL